ncbi:MAG: NADPH-dependent FMN reductase [Ktedonobacterales bacterium]
MNETTRRPFHIVGISGSLRTASYNTGLLRAAQEVTPTGVTVEIADISRLPLYNEDLNVEGGPQPVRDFKAQLRTADALLFAVAEYNYSLSGVLKNAIDWASRPLAGNPLRFKPAAMMGVGGQFGTVRAQLTLRQIFVFTETYALLKPELMVMRGEEHFDAQGNLTDQVIRERLRVVLDALVVWAQQVKRD